MVLEPGGSSLYIHDVEKDGVLSLVNATEKALRISDDNSQSVTKGTAKSAAEYFASRSYHGLDINVSNFLPQKFLIGKSGKASGYKNENVEAYAV
ncbi:diphthamide biosynthesis protein 2-like [Dorcoceras hygrometricum]|nr:diphthamide biosynthesis protein 2-like [Dorcoceras hygrometricum]